MNGEVALSTRRVEGGLRSRPFSPRLNFAVLALLGATSVSGIAHAQQESVPVKVEAPSKAADEIVVTGSLIRGSSVVGLPVVAFDKAQIQETGVDNVTDLLHNVANIPRVGLDPSNNGREPSNIAFFSTINIHGLDSLSTLTLLNGTRVANSGSQFVGFDASSIPTNALQRVDVLQDGSSATYGSDAVGGVVNLILRKPFDGAETSGRYSVADGYSSQELGQTFGKTWNSGGIFLAYQYNYHSNLPASERSFYTDDFSRYGDVNHQSDFPFYLGYADPATIFVHGPFGTPYAVPTGTNGRGLTVANLTKGLINAQSIFRGADVIGSERRHNAVVTLRQDITSNIHFDGDAFFDIRHDVQLGRAQFGSFSLPNTNPFFITGIPGAGTAESVRYSFLQDAGGSRSTADERSFRIAGNLTIDLGHDWRSDIHAAYSNDVVRTTAQGLNKTALAAAAADSNATTALNPFGTGANNNPATIANIIGLIKRRGEYSIKDLEAKFDGRLLTLPGGDVRVAFGAEARQDHMTRVGAENYLTGLPNNSLFENYLNVNESRTVVSVFGEAQVPIVGEGNTLPGIKRLSLSLALRYDHYSDFGGTTNPKFGLEWQTSIPGLSFGATFGRSFRAPTLVEKDSNTSISQSSLALTPGGPIVDGIVLMQDGGQRLKPVTAKTFTVGFDYKPDWLKAAKIYVHYYDVNTDHYIASPNVTDDFLYNPLFSQYVITKDPVSAQALGIQYLTTFPTSKNILGPAPVLGDNFFIIDARDANLGHLQTRGLDFGVSFGWNSRIGSWTAEANGTYVFTFRQQGYEGGPYTEYVNTSNGNVGAPLRFQGRAALGWRLGGFHSMVAVNYNNAYTNQISPNAPTEYPIAANGTVDLTAGYDAGENLNVSFLRNVSINLRVRNLFDKNPPIALTYNPPLTVIAIDTYHADVIGRQVSLSLTKRW